MNIKQQMIFVLVSVVLLSTTALATPIIHDTNSKASLKAPIAAFSAHPTSGNLPLKVEFTDKSTGLPTSWKWNFGDGTSSIEKNPVHVYNKEGKYTVTLSVKNVKGSSKITKYNYIIVLAHLKPPVAAFTASPTSGYSPLSVVFTDTSTGTPTSWYWNFGDGTSSKEKNPVHVYNKKGKYTVTLTVKNVKDSNKITKYNYIIVLKSALPVANFSTNVSEGSAPLFVQFTDHSKNAAGVNWDFDNDGVIDSTDRNPVHEYTSPGKYTVNLTAINANSTDSKLATINVSEKHTIVLPVANFSSNVTKGYAPLSIQFNDSSENATEWNWEFGDGANSTDKNPVHIYSNDGTYNVTLTAKNVNGNNKTTKNSYITVDSTKVVDVICKMKIYKITAKYTSEYKGKTYYFCNAGCKAKFDANPEKYVTVPVANFSTNVSEGYAPLSVQFTDLSENATEISWDFDSNGVIDSTDKNPVHVYSVPGNYIVNLTAVNSNGKVSKSASINVLEKTATRLPVANFSSNVTRGYAPLSVQFTDLSENATGWDWEFGDGANLIDKNPVHVYSSEGIYNVTLTVTNDNGSNKTTKYGYITVESTKVVDVVCKMVIDKSTAKYTSNYKGKMYYFCSAYCKEEFDANPEKYINS